MDAIVIAGGRGRRMGALTLKRQKGSLKYHGKPIVWRILETLAIPEISSVRIVAGYQSDDLHRVLSDPVYRSGFQHPIVEIDAVGVYGELTKLAFAMCQMPKSDGCIFTGVDTIFPVDVMRRFARMAVERDEMLLLLSKKIEIAPTHRRVRINRRIVVGYEAPEHASSAYRYVDTSVRYYPCRIVDELRHTDVPLRTNHDAYMQRLVQRGERMRAYVYRGVWKHFATPRDLSK